MPIQIRNPHSVLAALQTRPKDVTLIVLPKVDPSDGRDAWSQVARLAKEKGVSVRSGSGGGGRSGGRDPRDSRDEGGRFGVAEATVKEREGISAEELFGGAQSRGGGLWLALDSLQDPHNVGAIFRTAAFFGVRGILMTQERSAPLSGVAYDVASGGLEHVPFTQQVNLQRAFEVAKKSGLWILGTSEHAGDSLDSIAKDRPWLLVLGNEEKGMRRLTEESCDLLCRIPAKGQVGSLNVSVAAGICISRLA